MTTLKLAGAIALALIVAATATDAHAKKRKSESRELALLQRLLVQNSKMERELAAIRRQLRPDAVVESSVPLPHPNRNRLAVAPVPIPDPIKDSTLAGYSKHIEKSSKVGNLTPALAAKVREILAACDGTRLTSSYRPGARVRGSGRPSLHSQYPSKAADLAGNPACIRKHLAGWKGGLSTDYAAVRHYHVSYDPNGREWGRRFAHYGSRYARHHRRYASVR